MSTEQEEKALGERMVEAEKKMKDDPPWPAEASMFADNVGMANAIAAKMAAHERDRERDREPTLSERLDQIEALLEQLLRRVG